jgi:cell division protein FtsA
MTSSHPLVALDIGATKVACAIGLPAPPHAWLCQAKPRGQAGMPTGDAGGIELLGSSVVPYPALSEAWLGDLLMVSRAVEQALEAAAVRGDFDRALVAVRHPMLASARVRVSVTLGDEPVAVRAQDLGRLQAAALDQVLGIDREPLLVERLGCSGNGFDGVRDPRGLSATRLFGTFHIVTFPIAARRALVQAVEAAGLEVARLTYTLPASMAGVADDDEWRRQRILLVDVGGLATDVGVFAEGILQAARIAPWGGVTLAAAVARELGVTMDQAVAWTLEGDECRKPRVRDLLERQWASLHEEIDGLLAGEPRPERVLLAGRGALIGGFAESVERHLGIPTSLGRSARVSQAGDLGRQVGLNAAIGMLEMARARRHRFAVRSPRLLNRLLDRTRTILTEYF